MAEAYLSLKMNIQDELNQNNDLKLKFFELFNFNDLFPKGKLKSEIKGSTVFKSIRENFKISILRDAKEVYSLKIKVEEIVPSSKPTKFKFSYIYDEKTVINGFLKIEMYLYPLDTYILEYFYYTTFGLGEMNDTDIQKSDSRDQENRFSNKNFFNIVDSITNEIILYNPNINQRQLDSLYFAASILFLFHEHNHIADDLLLLIPSGVKYPFLLDNDKKELRKIFLEEFRDTKIQLDRLKINLSDDVIINKTYNMQIGLFITQLEELFFQFIGKLNSHLNMKYGIGISQNKDQNQTQQKRGNKAMSNISSIALYNVKLEQAKEENKELSEEKKGIINNITISTAGTIKGLLSDAENQESKTINDTICKIDNISLKVDLSPGWILDEKDKKDQILVSEKKGTLYLKDKFILFNEPESDLKIKIPYKIIDSYTTKGQEFINQNRIRPTQTQVTSESFKPVEKSEKELDDNSTNESLYIYDGAQLYEFNGFNSLNISNWLTKLAEYTCKPKSELFYENLRRSWKKDQLYILQTESFKRLVTETGVKVQKFLKNLLNPNTYTLSDIIIMQNSCIQREDVAIDTLYQLKRKWKKYLTKSGEAEKKIQLIKVTQKIFTEKVAVSSQRLFKELMDWVDSLQNSHYIMVEWTDVGRKANRMFQKMKNYSMINVHQFAPMNAGDFFNEQLIKPYLVKYTQMPEE